MNRYLLALSCGCLAAVAASAHAETAPTVEVVAPAPLPQHVLRELTGSYRLSDGRRLTVAHHGLHLYAAFDRQRPMRLVDTGGHAFDGVDGRTTVAFEPSADGSVERLRLTTTAAAPQRVSQAVPR